VGRGEPLTAKTLKPGGGGGVGRGEPLAAKTLKPGGGGGVGRGEPLAAKTLKPGGGGGVGRGEPLRTATETTAPRLLDKCLTELSTGSTIKTTKASNAS
jgi:hypothetical protein